MHQYSVLHETMQIYLLIFNALQMSELSCCSVKKFTLRMEFMKTKCCAKGQIRFALYIA